MVFRLKLSLMRCQSLELVSYLAVLVFLERADDVSFETLVDEMSPELVSYLAVLVFSEIYPQTRKCWLLRHILVYLTSRFSWSSLGWIGTFPRTTPSPSSLSQRFHVRICNCLAIPLNFFWKLRSFHSQFFTIPSNSPFCHYIDMYTQRDQHHVDTTTTYR